MANARAIIEANRVAARPTRADRERIRTALNGQLRAPRRATRGKVGWFKWLLVGAVVGGAAGVGAAMGVSAFLH